MDERTAALVRYLLEAMEIDQSPVINVRPWFSTEEGMVTFRVATASREIHHISLPQGFSLNAEVELLTTGIKCLSCHTMVAGDRIKEHACMPQ